MHAALAVKASLLLLLAVVGGRALTRLSAASRHRLWTAWFAALLTLPALAISLPPLYVPLPAELMPRTAQGTPASPVAPRTVTPELPPIGAWEARDAPTSFRWPPAESMFTAVWIAGTSVSLVMLLVSLVRARGLGLVADEVTDPAWIGRAGTIAQRLGLRQAPRLLVGQSVRMPMAAGLVRSVVFLPPAAREWGDECRDVVLAHEIAHLASRDPLRHVLLRLVLAAYWFHPLAWLAARDATSAREQACDAAVLAMGTRPSAYARILLELADSLRGSRIVGAVPMVGRSTLETRLMRILNGAVVPTARLPLVVPATAIALCTLSAAAAQPAQAPPSRAPATASPATPPTTPVAAQAPPAPSAGVDDSSLRAELAALRQTVAAMRAMIESMRAQEAATRTAIADRQEVLTQLQSRLQELSGGSPVVADPNAQFVPPRVMEDEARAIRMRLRQLRSETDRAVRIDEMSRRIDSLRGQNPDELTTQIIAELERALRMLKLPPTPIGQMPALRE